jgi:hypothetical protein
MKVTHINAVLNGAASSIATSHGAAQGAFTIEGKLASWGINLYMRG